MFDNDINYKSIAYSVTKGYLDERTAKFYLHWQEKLKNIDFMNLSLVDKVFVVMCQEQKLGSTWWELKQEHHIVMEEKEVYDILLNCQCYDIEITAMAKSFLYYQYSNTKGLEEQIYSIRSYGKIDLPYEYHR